MTKKKKKKNDKLKGIMLIIVLVGSFLAIHQTKEEPYQNLPSYSIKIIEEAKVELEQITKSSQTFSFSFITDLHINNEQNSENNMLAFSKMTNEKEIKFGVVGGDLYTAYQTNHEQGIQYIQYIHDFLTKKIKDKNLFFTKGNHDCNAKLEKSEFISNEEYYNMITKSVEKDVIKNEQDKDGNYYYKDFEKEKIRICVLNSFEGEGQQYIFKEKELTFIANDMLNFTQKENPEQWQVIFFSHTASVEDREEFDKIVDAFQKGEKIQVQGKQVDYTKQGKGNVIAFIAGHSHVDTQQYHNGYWDIVVQRGFNLKEEKGTENEICFSIFTIDLEKKILYETRCGRGENRQWNYEEEKEILDKAA